MNPIPNPGNEKYDHRIRHLKEEHQKLDDEIDKLERSGGFKDSEIATLKKKRLHVRDQIDDMERKKETNESRDARYQQK